MGWMVGVERERERVLSAEPNVWAVEAKHALANRDDLISLPVHG